MLNQMVMIGRLNDDVILEEVEGKTLSNVKLVVPRPYKNEKGEFESDVIPVKVWNGIAENMKEYCHKDDLIGIKGRIEMDGDKITIIAEKITFLSSKKSE